MLSRKMLHKSSLLLLLVHEENAREALFEDKKHSDSFMRESANDKTVFKLKHKLKTRS